MPTFAIVLATAALVVSAVSQHMFLGLGLAMFAASLGWLGYRDLEDAGWRRLLGAGAFSVALCALLLAGSRIALTFWAVDRLADSVESVERRS